MVYVATGTNYPDALAAIPLAAITDSPLLLTEPNRLPSSTAPSSTDSTRSDRGARWSRAVSATVMARLDATRPVRSPASRDPIATTAAAIAGPFPSGLAFTYLATGTSFADALTGGPVAAKRSVPMLLVAPKSLPAPTAAQLDRIKPERLVVLGGLAVVSDEVAAAAAIAAR